jgi:dynactin complex subunit
VSELERCNEQEHVLPLLENVDKLQAENTGLRDRNDELTVEVEALTAKLASLKTKKYVGYVDCSVNSKTCLSIPITITGIGVVDVYVLFCEGRNLC